MAAAISNPSPSPSSHGVPVQLVSLPPIITDGHGKQANAQRVPSYYNKDRLSMYSAQSLASQNRSRPGSYIFPIFHSSLPYAVVRDFAYPTTHPLHYGPPPPRASSLSSPVSEHRRLSDPPVLGDGWRGQWSERPWSADHNYGHQHLPAMTFGDGPPYSEDEDLHSPVITTSRQRREERGTLVSLNADGSEMYYMKDDDTDDDGSGGEYVTNSAHESRYLHMNYGTGDGSTSRNAQNTGFDSGEETRYSRDFQFAVGCPDEEMHGRAVALFDFEQEHENELPLKEGQVIFVSYRHGQGWLVAEDPETGESGLVPEEFVRLLRDIEGGLMSLNGDGNSEVVETNSYSGADPVDSDQGTTHLPTNGSARSSNGYSEGDNHEVTSADANTGELASPAENSKQESNAEPPTQSLTEMKQAQRSSGAFAAT